MITPIEFDIELIDVVMTSTDISVLFDARLNYVVVNDAACHFLVRKREEIVGRCILDVYPEIIASPNHRNLLRALEGQPVINFELTTPSGMCFFTDYIPVNPDGVRKGILVNSRQLEKAA